MWHKRQDQDAGLQWLRGLVVKFIRERAQRHELLLSQCCRKAYCEDTVKRLMAQRKMDSSEFTPAHLQTANDAAAGPEPEPVLKDKVIA